MSRLFLPLLVLAGGCAPADPLTRYQFVAQWLGDVSYEQGPTVCGVARSRRHLHALLQDSNLTCRPHEYFGSPNVAHAYSSPPAWIEGFSTAIQPPPSLVPKVRAWGEWSVGLMPSMGVSIDRMTGELSAERLAVVRAEAHAPFRDLEVVDGWVWLAGGDGVVTLEIAAIETGEEGVHHAPLAGAVLDLYVAGDRAAALVEASGGQRLVVLDAVDPSAPAVLGELDLTGALVDGVGFHEGYAYLTSGEQLYTVDATDPRNLRLVDEAGVAAARGGVTLIVGHYLFQAPGFDAVLGVTDLSDPAHPVPFWGFIGGNGVFDVAVAGHLLYLAVGSGGVHMWGPERDYATAFGP